MFGEQLGPGRAARAMAIVHLAVFEVVNAVEGDYKSYVGLPHAKLGTSMQVGVAQAAHDTLAALFPSQAPAFDTVLAEELEEIPEGRLKTNGIALGKRAASAILAARANDGSQHPEPQVGIEFLTSNDPGKWRQDPISLIPLALGAYWGKVKPFVLERGDQFRVPLPPRIDSPDYAVAYNEVKTLGGDGVVTPTTRSAEQTQIGIYWAYDGTPSLCAPPRLYNQITMQIAHKMGTDTDALELARLLALVNVAMADAGIAIWESKYYYQYWRPITGIREADERTGPSGLGDGNPATAGDSTFSPLGAPASNLTGRTLPRRFRPIPPVMPGLVGRSSKRCGTSTETDRIPFTFVSDEFNGVTRGQQWHRAAGRGTSLLFPLAGGGGKRTESHLSRHPLGLRQNRGHRAGPQRGRLRVQEHVAPATTKDGNDSGIVNLDLDTTLTVCHGINDPGRMLKKSVQQGRREIDD